MWCVMCFCDVVCHVIYGTHYTPCFATSHHHILHTMLCNDLHVRCVVHVECDVMSNIMCNMWWCDVAITATSFYNTATLTMCNMWCCDVKKMVHGVMINMCGVNVTFL